MTTQLNRTKGPRMGGVIEVRRTGAADYGRKIKALICGAPGAGKTLLSSTSPDPLFLVTEPGLMSVADRDVPYIEIDSTDKLETVLKTLQQKQAVREKMLDGTPVQTVVIDTIDELQLIFVAERLKETKKDAMQLQDYGWLKEQSAAFLKAFRNLDLHVIFTCHVKDDKDEVTGQVRTKPNLAGAISNDIPGFVDLSLLLRAELTTKIIANRSERVVTRYLQTFQDPAHDWVKDRSGKLPTEFPVNFTDDFDRLADLIYGGLPPVGFPEVEHEAPLVVTEPATPVADEVETSVVAAEAAAPAAEPAYAASCSECGTGVDENTADYSTLKARRVLCASCLKAA